MERYEAWHGLSCSLNPEHAQDLDRSEHKIEQTSSKIMLFGSISSWDTVVQLTLLTAEVAYIATHSAWGVACLAAFRLYSSTANHQFE